jgi:hypothetical protein
MTPEQHVSNIAEFLHDFIPKRNLTHLLPAPLKGGANLKERAHHNYLAAMSVLANIPLENVCSTKENPGNLAIKPVRVVVEDILTKEECQFLEAKFDDRVALMKKSGDQGERPGELMMDFLNIGPSYAWDNKVGYTQDQRFGVDHDQHPDQNADSRYAVREHPTFHIIYSTNIRYRSLNITLSGYPTETTGLSKQSCTRIRTG